MYSPTRKTIPQGRQTERRPLSPSRPTMWSRAILSLIALLLALSSANIRADHADDDESYKTGWSFQFDNDLFAGGQRDQDYTGGMVVTLSGRRAQGYSWTPERIRNWVDQRIGLGGFTDNELHQTKHALEWGTALFTPNDITSSVPKPQDRPYASLFFLNSIERSIIPARKLSVKSELTIGFLGLGLAESLQRGIHGALGNTKPNGWKNQISKGGELTAKYSLSFQKSVYQRRRANSLGQELNFTGKMDLGFTTGVGVGFNWRLGRINTPWWSFNPHQSEYLNLGSNISTGTGRSEYRSPESYIYVGGTLNYTAYNAFLQGQFRDSVVEADRSDVIANTAEIWGGVSHEFAKNLRVDVFLRTRTRELDLPESRALSWGGLIFSRSN